MQDKLTIDKKYWNSIVCLLKRSIEDVDFDNLTGHDFVVFHPMRELLNHIYLIGDNSEILLSREEIGTLSQAVNMSITTEELITENEFVELKRVIDKMIR